LSIEFLFIERLIHVLQCITLLANPSNPTVNNYFLLFFAVAVAFGLYILNSSHVMFWHWMNGVHVVNGHGAALTFSQLLQRYGVRFALAALAGLHRNGVGTDLLFQLDMSFIEFLFFILVLRS
jgi:hypothetical protein